MSEPGEAPEIWFERIGPTIGWLGSYSPVSIKGFYVMLAYTLPVLFLWVLPISLLAQFDIMSAEAALLTAVPVVCVCLISLMRTAYRHSAPRS